MSATPRLQRAPGCVWRRWQGSVLVMSADREAFQLDGAAALLWQHLEAPASVDEVVDAGLPSLADAPGEPLDLMRKAAQVLVDRGYLVEVGS